MINKTWKPRGLLAGFLLIFIATSFLTLPRNPLLNDDAALYALAAKNAVVHNQWLAQFITPGDPSSFLDKPPLGIWLLAWIPKMVGINELTIHFPNVMYYCFLLWLMYFGISKLSSKRIAFYATLIASTSLALVVYSRAPKLDVLLTLFILAAHLALYAFLESDKKHYLYVFALCLAGGFLIKSGFGIILPGLTVLFLLFFNSEARKKLLKILPTCLPAGKAPNSFLCLALFSAIVFGVLGIQSLALKDQWIPYLKSFMIQSKYNTSYLGFGFNYSIVGLLLITLFPWTPLFLSSLSFKLRTCLPAGKALSLRTFCNLWFWSNFLFLLFFYRQTDFRTFTVLVPPMAILAGIKLISVKWKPEARRRGFQGILAWNLFFLFIFTAILIALINKPVNPDGISLSAAILPIALFVLALLSLTVYFWKPSRSKFVTTFALVCISYGVLFYNTLPIANAFNLDVKWPAMIKEYRAQGAKFYVYRPPDRKLFMSPDLFYVDFISGPADEYFWSKEKLLKALAEKKAIILSDTESWKKMDYNKGEILAQDNYSLVAFNHPRKGK